MRLGGGVVDQRLALGQHRGHDRVLGRRHRRFVEEHVRAAERSNATSGTPAPRLRSARRATSSARRCVSTRRRPMASPPGLAMLAAPQRASSGPASRIDARIFSREIGIGAGRAIALRLDADDVRLQPLDRGADAFHDLKHDADVLNVGQVAQDDGLVGQQTRRQDRQRRVLVSARTDASLQPAATFNDEAFHHVGGIVCGCRSERFAEVSRLRRRVHELLRWCTWPLRQRSPRPRTPYHTTADCYHDPS